MNLARLWQNKAMGGMIKIVLTILLLFAPFYQSCAPGSISTQGNGDPHEGIIDGDLIIPPPTDADIIPPVVELHCGFTEESPFDGAYFGTNAQGESIMVFYKGSESGTYPWNPFKVVQWIGQPFNDIITINEVSFDLTLGGVKFTKNGKNVFKRFSCQ